MVHPSRGSRLIAVALAAIVVFATAPAHADTPTQVDVTAAPYGAAGDGVTNDRLAIQKALDDVAGHGGGTVVLPAGHTFLSGSLTVGSRTTIEIDGTLRQSQSDADYGYTPIHGHNLPPTSACQNCQWDHALYHNLPFIYAGHRHDVRVTGGGVIQMTQTNSDATSIHLSPIGFYRVSGYQISDLRILDATVYNLSLFTTDHGLVEGVTITTGHANTDGISLQNSQHVRIAGNTIRNGDDAIYVWESYRDPRAYVSPLGGKLWWSSDDPQPSTDIEIDHNTVAHSPGLGAGFILWGAGAPDQRAVSVSDVRIHDNSLTSTSRAIGCWCDNPYHGQSPFTNTEKGDQSPLTDVRVYNNVVNSPTLEPFVATDFSNDYGALGTATVMNADFTQATAWWTTEGGTDGGPASDVGATDAAHAAVLRSPQAQAAIGRLDGMAGYLQPRGSRPARLTEGLGLSGDIAGVPFPTSTYTLSAKLVTGDRPVLLSAYDTCTGQTLAGKRVTAPTPTRESLTFQVGAGCANVRVGVTASGGGTWALVDDVAIDRRVSAIDNDDPGLTYTGDWKTSPNNGTWGGTDAVGLTTGSAVTIPFTGVRAVLLAVRDHNLGVMEVAVDGGAAHAVDLYAESKTPGEVVFDTGDLAPGAHTLSLAMSGQRNPASLGALVDWDALLAQPSPN